MEWSTPAFQATAATAAGSIGSGGWMLWAGDPISWPALFAVVLGAAAIGCATAARAPRFDRIGSSGAGRYLSVTALVLTTAGVVAALWALTVRSDRVAALILAGVVLGAALRAAAWAEFDLHRPVRITLTVAGAGVVAAAAGTGAYVLSGTVGMAVAAGAVTFLIMVYGFSSHTTAHTPLPLEVGWIGPVAAVATSALAAQPLADRFAADSSGSATVVVGIASIVAGAQFVVQAAVVRMLQPTVAPAAAVEHAAAARTAAGAVAAHRGSTDFDIRLPAEYEELVYHIRAYGSRSERDAVEAALERARRSGDSTDMRLLLREFQQITDETSWTPRWSLPRARQILVNSAAVRITVATAREEGIVIDRMWPRLELVLPAPVRRRHAWSDRAVGLSRVVTASAIAAAITFVAASLHGYTAVPLVLASAALFAGRSRLEEVYRQRARTIAIFRMDLVRALQLPEPATRAELVALGGVLDGDVPFDRMATRPRETGTSGQVAADFTERFTPALAELRAEMRALGRQQEARLREVAASALTAPAVERITTRMADAAAERLNERLAEAVTTLRAQTGETITEAVRAVIAGPPLIEFSGYFVIELAGAEPGVRRAADRVIDATPGTPIGLAVTLVADQAAADVAPDRGAANAHDFVALETVTIKGLTTETWVEFEVLLDSATMTPAARRRTFRLLRRNGERRAEIDLEIPDSEGVHEAWLQLYQAGRLVQAVAIAVDTRVTDRSARGER